MRRSQVFFYLFVALTASCLLYNRTEHSPGCLICFMTNNTTIFSHIRIIFKNKPYFTRDEYSFLLVSLLILQLYYIILVSIFILYYTSFYIVIISE